tara:strand:+ start:7784 stop:7927 length:144 start_codon:yes stop_codon:yes gene_type:complete
MNIDLIIPLFWTLVFSYLVYIGVKRVTKKQPTEKKWVRPSKEKDNES